MGQARPVTASGRVAQALSGLLPPQTLPLMEDAVRRACAAPATITSKKAQTAKKDAHYTYRYTRGEIGEILAFTWWLHRISKRKTTPRTTVRKGVEALSVLRLYSGQHLGDLTGTPKNTATKWMIPVPGAPTSRVLGTCAPDVIKELLDASADGMDAYRNSVNYLGTTGIGDALLARLSGIPKALLTSGEEGHWFYAEECDISHGRVLGPPAWASYHRKAIRKGFDPRPDNHLDLRFELAGTPVDRLPLHQAAVPLPGEVPFHMRIGGLPWTCPGTDKKAHGTINRWELLWGIPARDEEAKGHLRNCLCEK